MANYRRKKTRTEKARKMKQKQQSYWWLWAILVGLVIYLVAKPGEPKTLPNEVGYDAAIANYGAEIKVLSQKYDLNKDYLMALIMLECSGRRDVPPRFEKGVYNKLKDVKSGKRKLEGISADEIGDANDDALKNLASSWGPFQLMGYKCLHLNIQIKDLRGPSSLEHGVEWINRTYGDYIRKGRYEDAFHIHNTGHAVKEPGKYKTYDPEYIPRGLKHMEYFSKNF